MYNKPRKRAKKTLPPPEWMNKEASEVWEKLSRHLTRTGKLTKENSHLLEVYCITYCQWRKIAYVLMNSNVILPKKDKNGKTVDYKAVPLLYPFEQFGRTLCKYAHELGLITAAQDDQSEAGAESGGETDLWENEEFQSMINEISHADGQGVQDADGG